MKGIIHIASATTPENYGCVPVPQPKADKMTHISEKVNCKKCRKLLEG